MARRTRCCDRDRGRAHRASPSCWVSSAAPLGAAPDQRLRASADGYASTDGAAPNSGRLQLVAGGLGGGAAVTYLKFDVGAVRGRVASRRSAEVALTRRAGELPPVLELSRVPATGGWRTRWTVAAPRGWVR